MRELGAESARYHGEIAAELVALAPDLLAAVGEFVPALERDTTPVLVGYKGSSEADAPAFYCPYIPLMSSGVVLDPSTFEPVVSFMTRYGYIELTNTASSFGNAGDYVGEIAVSNLSFS
jgi:hypothetical protein